MQTHPLAAFGVMTGLIAIPASVSAVSVVPRDSSVFAVAEAGDLGIDRQDATDGTVEARVGSTDARANLNVATDAGSIRVFQAAGVSPAGVALPVEGGLAFSSASAGSSLLYTLEIDRETPWHLDATYTFTGGATRGTRWC